MLEHLLAATLVLAPVMAASRPASFASALSADGPAPDRAREMDLYGWLVGDWTMTSILHAPDGATKPGPDGEVHAAWTLEGRAIQDVWILPGFFYGTTLRIYDPGLGAWHILWSDPVKQYFTRQVGRAEGGRIVQAGKEDSGAPVRWSFSDVTGNSFRWLGERSDDGGATWRPQIEFLARRTAPAPTAPARTQGEAPGGAAK